MKAYRKIVAMALGERDCAIGKKPVLKNPEYLRGYSRQYQREQSISNKTTESF